MERNARLANLEQVMHHLNYEQIQTIERVCKRHEASKERMIYNLALCNQLINKLEEIKVEVSSETTHPSVAEAQND